MAFVRTCRAGMAVVLATALVGLAAGCGDGEAATPSPVPTVVSPVRHLADLLRGGVEVDYEPLASPDEAVRLADLIVTGVIVDIADGPEREGGRGPTVLVHVDIDRIIAGGAPDEAAGVVRVELLRGSDVSVPDLRDAIVPVMGAYILDEVGADEFGDPIYAPFAEGIWLDDPTASRPLQGVLVPAEALPVGWGVPLTLDDLIARLDEAASAP